jgi:hypothetical protein
MKRIAWPILVHLCSLLILMPVGWCCWLPALPAQGQPKEPDCCCCAKPAKPVPVKPGEESPQAPICCCDPQPAAFLSLPDQSGKPAPDAFPAMALPMDAGFAPVSVTVAAIAPFLRDPAPPRHLLHCVWLC